MALPESSPTHADRLAGGLLGLLIGDALGVPYEFHPPEAIPPSEQLEFVPPPGFRRSHFGVPPGTWSDDGAHALILLDSLLSKGQLDLDHLGFGLRQWLHQGFCAVNGAVFDIGAQTSTAINRLMSGIPAEQSGPADESHNGNGSLMRALPLALWHQGSPSELSQLATRQSLPTHGHIRSQVCCAMYCLWAKATLLDLADPWDTAERQLVEFSTTVNGLSKETALVLDPKNSESARGTGYVLDTLWSARAAILASDTYEGCVKHAIRYGHDTDTTAAVAGGIAGLKYGVTAIPERWRSRLRGDSIYRPLLERLLARTRAASFDADLKPQ